MPAMQDIRAVHAEAVIDCGRAAFAPLVRRVAGARVIEARSRRWRRAWWTARTRPSGAPSRAQLQEEQYDAVIDPQGLTKSAIVAAGTWHALRLRPTRPRVPATRRRPAGWWITPSASSRTSMRWTARACWSARRSAVRPKGRRSGLKPQAGVFRTTSRRWPSCTAASRDDKLWPVEHWGGARQARHRRRLAHRPAAGQRAGARAPR